MQIKCKVDNKREIFSIGDKQKADTDKRTIEAIQQEIKELRKIVPKDPGPDPGEAYNQDQWKASLAGNLTADTSLDAYNSNSEVASQRENKERYDREKEAHDAYKASPQYAEMQQLQELLRLKKATISPETLIFEDSDIDKSNGSINDAAKIQLQAFQFTDDQISDLEAKAKIIHGLKQKVAECLANPLASKAETKYLEQLKYTLICQESLSGRLKDFYKTLQKPPKIELSDKAWRFLSYFRACYKGKITLETFKDYLFAKEEHIIASKVFKKELNAIHKTPEAAVAATTQECQDKFHEHSQNIKKL